MPHLYAICQLHPDKYIPHWAVLGDFASLTHTNDELSVVCEQDNVPHDIKAERGWHCIKVQGSFDFSQAGIHASLATPLAEANISAMSIATYSTDYLLVKEENLEHTLKVLERAGHQVMR
jgi:hypothetical protein